MVLFPFLKCVVTLSVCCVPVCVLISCHLRQEKTAREPGPGDLLSPVCNITHCYVYVFFLFSFPAKNGRFEKQATALNNHFKIQGMNFILV